MSDIADLNRPDPEALLERSKKEDRGRLKIFLGMAPGVGKTYAMLRAARQKKSEGKDVMIAVVETHRREETQALVDGLEILPRKTLRYRDKDFQEMDIDAVLLRNPEIVLVDELAHTNIEGSRHAKRYQDVEELLAAGINVYTTLNIQHLESLNDIIERITKVKVQETLPDAVLQSADEIELIDIPPDDLIQRLGEGKVYLGDMAQRAMESFFVRGNLMALREMALRTAAERVDRDVSQHMKTHGVSSIWPTNEKLLVCIDESGNAETLIRMGARMAARAKTPWIVLYVETHVDAHLTENEKDNIAESLSMAEKLGGEAITIRGGTNIAADIIAFARARNISRILIGRHGKSWLSNIFFPSVSSQLVATGNEFDITLLHATKRDKNESGLWRRFFALSGKSRMKDYFEATLAVMFSLAAALLVRDLLPLPNVTLIFLVGVLFSAVRSGLWPSIYCVIISSLTINFFFTEPLYTLSIYSHNDVMMLVFFMIVAVFTGNLAVRLKDQIEALQISAYRNATMHDFSRKLSVALSLDDVIREAVTNTAESFNFKTILLMPDMQKDGQLIIVGMEPDSKLGEIDWAAAEWSYKNDKPAGLGCDTLPAASWLFKPLRSPQGLMGLMAISPKHEKKGDTFNTPEQRRMLYAFCDQIALALERARLTVDIEESRLQNETERLRTALLSSVSHDLRTPLASIIGSATTLSYMDQSLSHKNRTDLIHNILQESERLNRFVQNLLDMTRLGHGNMEPKREWIGDVRDILGRAASRLQKVLLNYKVEYRIDDDVSNLYVDPVLIEQVMVNILENAAKYSVPYTRILISLENDREGSAFLKISDQGQGIPEEDREKVFDMFYRVRAGDSKIAGTGLGLAICRGIIAAHGGSIHAEAGFMGKGTVIVIRFPPEMARPKSFMSKTQAL